MKKFLFIFLIVSFDFACSYAQNIGLEYDNTSMEQSSGHRTVHYNKFKLPLFVFKDTNTKDKIEKLAFGALADDVPLLLEFCNDMKVVNIDGEKVKYNLRLMTFHYEYKGYSIDSLDKVIDGCCYIGNQLCYIKGKYLIQQMYEKTDKFVDIEFMSSPDACKCEELTEYLIVDEDSLRRVPHDCWDDDCIAFGWTDEAPVFEGGNISLKHAINSEVFRSHNYKGERVVVKFIIDKNGKVKNPHIVKGANPSFDECALNVVSNLKGFKAGMYKGNPVNVYMEISVPYNF